MKVRIAGRRCLIGNDISFENRSMNGLNVGDKITQIGDGRDSGCYSTELIKPYMTYCGVIFLEEEFMAFLLPKSGVRGWNLFRQPENVYALYFNFDDNHIGAYRDLDSKILLYKKIFEFYKEKGGRNEYYF